ncbi:hypothetical protein [Chryseobacterium turcicum]|uniref:Uncharacterized protein n=1 Tax=Chryseobacterium turcicum TaxID=2898076 RepID=A0A9Q3UZW1_9FLAO|nr:hypothetical protein [Chryseobacterium turcicum]MCD1115562.1 hypothetical protein [Chryseobacterium turcicum]
MSKFLLEKKKLIEDVYEKAAKETTETSFSGILLHLEQVLKDDFESLSYKSFENYYKALVENGEDYKIKPSILDNLSNYLGFDSFNDYCSGWKSFEYKIHQALSNLVITVINKPIIKMPEFLTKQSNLGILGVLLVGGFFAGNKIVNNQPVIISKESETANISKENAQILGIVHIPVKMESTLSQQSPSMSVKQQNCMYWDDKEYKLAYCDDKNPQIELKPINETLVAYFQRITRKDTLTVDNAYGKVWYSKHKGNVEFFTSDGVDPNNGRELRKATEYIIDKYGGIQEEAQ